MASLSRLERRCPDCIDFHQRVQAVGNVPSPASGTAGPQLLASIPWNSATHSRSPGTQSGAALYGQLLSRGEAGISEVGLEKPRTSKAYRAKLEFALAQLLFVGLPPHVGSQLIG